jgi:hypothetical protein
MKTVIEELLKRSNKTTVQTLVRNFNIEQLGYMYADVIEDAFGVKKGTSSFGVAVSNLFSEYKVDKIRLTELDYIIKTSLQKYKIHYSLDEKRKQMNIHNTAVDEFTELNKHLGKFTRFANKFYKNLK